MSLKKFLSVICFLFIIAMPTETDAAGFYTKGNKIYNEADVYMQWNGLNWFGFETDTYAPHGLWTSSMDDMLDQVAKEGYNLIRVPYSNDMLKSTATVNGVDFYKNKELEGKKPIEVLDILIDKAAARQIYVLLDRHRPNAYGQSELWYTNEVSEQQWINDWVMLAKRYKNKANVIGADLHNEPHGQASWGTGDTKTDWRLAAERAGNAILKANPNWLIIVEGVERNVKGSDDNYWWGGNLQGVKEYPVRLTKTNKVVYSTHDYGAGVYHQAWFNAANFPQNMPAIWDKYWGYIHKQQIAPVLVGEFGGRQVDTSSLEGKWHHKLVSYIKENGLYWTYWSLNPNSGDTGGLLQDDWNTWQRAKQQMLAPIMKPQVISDGTFYDVPKKHPNYADIQFVYEKGYINGYPSGYFKPNDLVTRKHMAAIIAKMPVDFKAIRPMSEFKDVTAKHAYYTAIQTLYTAGVLDGSNGYFNPEGTLRRAQMAKILVNVFQLQQNGPAQSFKDVKPTNWYAPYVEILASNGITSGADGYFMPNKHVTRAHFAAFITRISNKINSDL